MTSIYIMMFKDNIMNDHQHKFIYIYFNPHISDGSIAQLVEMVFYDSKVAGSNPVDVKFFLVLEGPFLVVFGDFYSIFESFMLDTQKVMYLKPIQ